MSIQRASWITVIVVCAIGTIALAISGYTGYSIVAAAVGAAAAVNLLPAPRGERSHPAR